MEIKIEENELYVYNITPEYDLTTLNLNNVHKIHIKGYYLDHFSIPCGISEVHIDYIGLKTLYIPDGTESVFCSRNFLRTIEIPSSLKTLVANKNLITEITFRSQTNNQLNYLDIRSNKLTKLEFDFPDSMEYFNASMNKLTSIAPKIQTFLRNFYSIPLECSDSYDSSSDDENWFSQIPLSKSL
jgi:Leucine-rich repeat (LRR) protein